MTTKQQERDALAKIRKIVEGLGADSYVATAFEGCFEIAEENIENDFACSMKQRYESEQAKRIEAELGYNRMVDKLAESEKDYEAAHAAAHEIADQKDAEIAELRQQLEAAKAKALPGWLYKSLRTAIEAELAEHKERMEELADSMADHAERPESPAFRNAVSAYRVRKEAKEVCEQTLQGLELVEPAGA